MIEEELYDLSSNSLNTNTLFMQNIKINISGIPKSRFTSLLLYVPTFFLIISLPYILEILSFISPVFVVVYILLIAFLPIVTNKVSAKCSKNELGCLLYAYYADLDWFLPEIEEGDEEVYPVEALELYKTVFETCLMDETENHVDSSEEHSEEKIVQAVESSILTISQNNKQVCKMSMDEAFTGSLKEDFLDDGEPERPKSSSKSSSVKERRLEEFFEGVDKFEYMDCREVDKSVDEQTTQAEMVKSESMRKRHSRRRNARTNIDFTENRGARMPRKEKEWKRTLACKFFEEKHGNNVEGSEAMDLLWETYEEERSMLSERKIGYFKAEEDEEEIDVQICCLHAFRFSGGKMNMGVGGQNLTRISKVVKGIRSLRASVTKHGKKMNNTGRGM